MAFTSKIVLELPISDFTAIPGFAEARLHDDVELVAVVGIGSNEVEDLIDELIVGDGSDDTRFIVTTSHQDEALEDVLEFAKNWIGDGQVSEPAQLVRL